MFAVNRTKLVKIAKPVAPVGFVFALFLTIAAIPPPSISIGRKSAPYGDDIEIDTHPKIRAAIVSLEAARAELARSDQNFGGHKQDAVDAVNNAIKQLRLAMEFEKY